jgi:hypothetical protein
MQRHHSHHDAVDEAFDRLLGHALDNHARKQAAFQARVSAFTRWSINQAGDALTFAGEALEPLTLSAMPIATYVVSTRQWAWAWANEGFDETARNKAARIKTLTDKTGYGIFQVPFFNTNGQDIDELCALALLELQGSAIFKIKDNEPWCFYVVDED